VSRRSNGEGSIYKRKDGHWIGKYTVNDNRKCVYGTTLLEIIASSLRLLKAL
jgi:hypothetical protein